MKYLKAFIKNLDSIIASLLVIMIFLDILLQVISRLTPGNAISWTLEVGQMLLAAVIWMGIGPGVSDDAHVRFDLILNKTPPKTRQYMIAIGDIIFACFMITLAVFTVQLLRFYAGNNSRTTVLGWSKAIIRLPMLIGCLVAAGKLLYQSVLIFMGKNPPKPSDTTTTVEGGGV